MAEIVPSAGKRENKGRWRSVWRTAALTLVLMLVAGAAGVGVRWLQDRGKTHQPLAKLPKVVGDVQNLRLSGNTDAANKKIADELKDTSLDSKTRYDLYLQQGHGFADKQDYNGAIGAYKSADQLNPTRAVAWLIGDMYKKLGDKTQAIAYYKKAIERVPADDPLADNDTAYLQSMVKDLEAK